MMETHGARATRFEPGRAAYLYGAKNTRSPTTAAPLNFWLRFPKGALMRIVENWLVSVSITPTLSAQHRQAEVPL